jgi:hypothetical protein
MKLNDNQECGGRWGGKELKGTGKGNAEITYDMLSQTHQLSRLLGKFRGHALIQDQKECSTESGSSITQKVCGGFL